MNNIEYLYALLTSKWDEPRIGKESLELAFPVWYTYNHIYNICRCTSSINFILWSLYIPNMFFLTFPTFPHPVGRPKQGRLRRDASKASKVQFEVREQLTSIISHPVLETVSAPQAFNARCGPGNY